MSGACTVCNCCTYANNAWGKSNHIAGDLPGIREESIVITVNIAIRRGRICTINGTVSRWRCHFHNVITSRQPAKEICSTCQRRHPARRIICGAQNTIRPNQNFSRAIAGIQLHNGASQWRICGSKHAVIIEIIKYLIT